jgi:hypothetical protein
MKKLSNKKNHTVIWISGVIIGVLAADVGISNVRGVGAIMT